MKPNNKNVVLHEHHLTQEVLDIYSLKVFIILDLLLFSAFFGILLNPLLTSFWLKLLLPLLFFTIFTVILHLFDTWQIKS
jgi:hypothetical protein